MPELHLAFLGPFQATQNAAPITSFRSNKERALLAYLAEEADQPHQRSILIGLLWPELPEHAALNNLSQTLSRVRSRFGPAALPPPNYFNATRQEIQFKTNSEIVVDTTLFSNACHEKDEGGDVLLGLENALQLYRGDFLEGLSLAECEEFEMWLLFKRERYRRLAAEAMERLAALYLGDGLYGDAQAIVHRHLALEPWSEVAHRQMMRALADNGERSAALVQYKQCQQLLWEELGVEPEAATIQLYAQIKQGIAKNELLVVGKPSGAFSTAIDGEISLVATHFPPFPRFEDWGEMPALNLIVGRDEEIEQLNEWIARQGARFVAILGIGGQGKTTLAASYVRSLRAQRQQPFVQIIWRSLLNAPPLAEILQSWLGFLIDESAIAIPQSLDERMGLLFQILRERRILLVLDNVESILAADKRNGGYRPGYEAYEQLFKRMAESNHQSCLLMTSREQPPGMARIARQSTLVRTFQLDGLSYDATIALLDAIGLEPHNANWQPLVERYSGNPLALMVVADTIDALFDGDVAAFLADGNLFFDDVRNVLDEQFARLTELERAILIWLAVERTGISAVDLRKNLLYVGSQHSYLEALRSLQRRSLLLRREGNGAQNEAQREDPSTNVRSTDLLTLQNVITEYTTELLVDAVCAEIQSGRLHLLKSHALLKTQAKEYIRESQQRLILEPITERLIQHMSAETLPHRISELLSHLRADPHGSKSYAAGNLLNLMLVMRLDVTGMDFSNLTIHQAFLRGKIVTNVNFANAEFVSSAFTDTFGDIYKISFSPDGQFLAAATSRSGEIHLWSGDGHQPVGILNGHSKVVCDVAWHDATANPAANVQGTNRLLVSGGEDGTVRLWTERASHAVDPSNRSLWHGQILHQGRAIIRSVAFRPRPPTKRKESAPLHGKASDARSIHDEIVAAADDQGQIRLWSVRSGECLATLLGHTHVITMISFSPDGSLLASCSADGTIRIWPFDETLFHGAIPATIHVYTLFQRPEDALEVWAVTFSPDGRHLAAGSLDGTIWFWSVDQLRTANWASEAEILPAMVLKETHQSIQHLAFSPDGKILASGGDDRLIRLWNVETGQVINTFQGHTDVVRTIAFRPDGQLMASGSPDGTLRFWDPRSGFPELTLFAYNNAVSGVSFGSAPDITASENLMTANSDSAYIWQLDHQQVDLQEGLDGQRASIEIAPNLGPVIEPIRTHLQHELSAHTSAIWDVAVSPNGRVAATGGHDRVVILWQLDDPISHQQLVGHEHIVTAVTFSPDNQIVASVSIDQTCRLWDVETGDCIAILTDGSGIQDVHNAIWSVAFSKDGRRVSAGFSNGAIILWGVASGKSVQTLRGHTDWVRGLAFDPTDQFLLSCGNDHSVRLWSLASGEERYQLNGHTDWVMDIAFHKDGKTVASASHDSTICLWQLDRLEEDTKERSGQVEAAAILRDHTNSVVAVDFSSDGLLLASASLDGTAKLWHVTSQCCVGTIKAVGPYANTNIAGAKGLTGAQRSALSMLGTVG